MEPKVATVVRTVSLQPKGSGFKSPSAQRGVCTFYPLLCGFAPGAPGSTSPETCICGTGMNVEQLFEFHSVSTWQLVQVIPFRVCTKTLLSLRTFQAPEAVCIQARLCVGFSPLLSDGWTSCSLISVHRLFVQVSHLISVNIQLA